MHHHERRSPDPPHPIPRRNATYAWPLPLPPLVPLLANPLNVVVALKIPHDESVRLNNFQTCYVVSQALVLAVYLAYCMSTLPSFFVVFN